MSNPHAWITVSIYSATACAWRWKIEQFHRETKQLTGLEKCQCRLPRIVRNYISCAFLVWVRLMRQAQETSSSKTSLFVFFNNRFELLKSPLIGDDPAIFPCILRKACLNYTYIDKIKKYIFIFFLVLIGDYVEFKLFLGLLPK